MEDRPLTRRRRIRFGRNEKGLERMTKVHKLIAGSLLVGSLAGGLGPGAGRAAADPPPPLVWAPPTPESEPPEAPPAAELPPPPSG
ncbi:hypothetical protein O980_17510 [Mycobacterium avium subsp. paratuberculosis 08-8281]|nr:hypothetical protein O980_17510 [Mycobacterium avium subsp. paratuberculosis 08-8281]